MKLDFIRRGPKILDQIPMVHKLRWQWVMVFVSDISLAGAVLFSVRIKPQRLTPLRRDR